MFDTQNNGSLEEVTMDKSRDNGSVINQISGD